MKPDKENREEILRDWYKPTKQGEKAREMLEQEHFAWFNQT